MRNLNAVDLDNLKLLTRRRGMRNERGMHAHFQNTIKFTKVS